jgi:hypothetical protein
MTVRFWQTSAWIIAALTPPPLHATATTSLANPLNLVIMAALL